MPGGNKGRWRNHKKYVCWQIICDMTAERTHSITEERCQREKISGGRMLILRKYAGWKEAYYDACIVPIITGSIPSTMEPITSSQNSRAWRVRTEDSIFFVKCFNPRGLKDRVVFRKSRAFRAVEGGAVLLRNGFLTPLIIAQGEIRKGLSVGENFMITEWIEDCFSTYAYLKICSAGPKDDSMQGKRDFLQALGRLVGKLHGTGVFHGDLRPGNILIKELNEGQRFYFIDNERNRFFPNGLPLELRERNLAQINTTIMPVVTRTDRMRFFRAYLNENPEVESIAKELMRRVFLKTRKKLSKKYKDIWEKKHGNT